MVVDLLARSGCYWIDLGASVNRVGGDATQSRIAQYVTCQPLP